MSDTDDPPYRFSAHERCSDPCPEIGNRFLEHPDFESIGMWGPFIETADGETIAEGHEEVEKFVGGYISEE